MAGIQTPAQRRRGAASAARLRLAGRQQRGGDCNRRQPPSRRAERFGRSARAHRRARGRAAPAAHADAGGAVPGGGVDRALRAAPRRPAGVRRRAGCGRGGRRRCWSRTRPWAGSRPRTDRAISAPRDRCRQRADRRGQAARPGAAELGIDPASGALAWEVALPAADPLADCVVAIDAARRGAAQARRAQAQPGPPRSSTPTRWSSRPATRASRTRTTRTTRG